MCVLLVKQDKDRIPNRAKSTIVVLGNFEDRLYEESQWYGPVLKYSSLRLLTAKYVDNKRVLQLAKHIKVNFVGDVDYFLSTAFTWLRHDNDHISVHLIQIAFTEFCDHRFGVDRMSRVPNMTPY